MFPLTEDAFQQHRRGFVVAAFSACERGFRRHQSAFDGGLEDGGAVALQLLLNSLQPCGVYFGTTGGQVYLSADGGDTWSPIVRDLPSVLSVEVQTLP